MEAIIGILGLVIEVGKCIAGLIERHLNYICCFSNNIQSLRDEAQKLKEVNDWLQMRVDAAKNDAQLIYPQVENWLASAIRSKDIVNGIENDVPKVQKGYLNLISRYLLSREAKKTAEALRKLHNDCKFDEISQGAAPASMDSLPLGPKEKFETRKKIEEDVMEALRDRNVNMIGLCGMGGIGKTTMADKIMDRVKEEKLFDETLKVVVSQEVDMPKLQQNIANQLGLTLDVEDLETRTHKIRTRLRNTKGILIVVDDVWEDLQLKDLGIPCRNTFGGSCTVLLTTRNKIALNMMETQRIFEIEILPESEAWLLFREKTNNCVDKEDLRSVAEEVAKECKGLPVALVTVGRALRNKTNRKLWDDARLQLRSSNPIVLPKVLEHVYKPLKVSYDYLENKQARSLFLLCSMFAEDDDIDHEMLTWYGMGFDMFEGLENLNEARNRTRTLIEDLKDRSLLLDGSNEHCVKMHDVVRDTAIYIASEEKCSYLINLDCPTRENCYEDCFWIKLTNLSNRTEFLVELNCPSLRVLTISNGDKIHDHGLIRLPDNFFNGMQKVKVLIVEKIWIRSLTPTTLLRDNLKTLCLLDCYALESISIVGELSKLEVLCCHGCRHITALPTEIGRLNRLRLLEIIDCRHLKRIAPGVISKLINLEELRIKESFDRWEAKESNAKENAALVELESLTKLTCLEIEIDDLSVVAEEICLSSNIAKYDIQIWKGHSRVDHDFSKSMSLKDLGQTNVGNWIKTLIRSTEFLYLRGDGADRVNLVEVEKLKRLSFERCSSVKKLINATKTSLFPSLEYLKLTYLDNLEEIIAVGYRYNDHYSCFGNLKRIYIDECPRLRYLFPIRSFPQLQSLTVKHCKAMEDIFYDDDKMEKDGNIISHKAFPNLKDLWLVNLPRLKASETLDKIAALDNLRNLDLCGLKDDGFSSLRGVFNSYRNLKRINIGDFNGIKNLMSPSIAGNLVHLEMLALYSCKMMLEVIGDDDEKVQVTSQISLFPRLEILDLFSLSKLRSFCQWNYHNTLELPSLVDLDICDCPKMETFTQGSMSTPKLEVIRINYRSIEIKDLNEAIQQQQQQQRRKSTSTIEEEEGEEGEGEEGEGGEGEEGEGKEGEEDEANSNTLQKKLQFVTTELVTKMTKKRPLRSLVTNFVTDYSGHKKPRH